MKLYAEINSEKMGRITSKAGDVALTTTYTIKNKRICQVIFTEEQIRVIDGAGVERCSVEIGKLYEAQPGRN